MPLNLGNLTAVTASEEELLLTSAEHDLALMDAIHELENCSNALEIVQKAKQTSSMECMNFAEELLGAQVSEEELVAALEAAETKTFDALRASFKNAKSIFDMYKKKLEGLDPKTVVKDPAIVATICRQLKQLYPFVKNEFPIPENVKRHIQTILNITAEASSGTNVRSLNAVLDLYKKVFDQAMAVIDTPMATKWGEKATEHGYDRMFPIFGSFLRLFKLNMRKLYYLAKNSKETNNGELTHGAKLVSRVGRIALKNMQ